jgi:putative endonuclease
MGNSEATKLRRPFTFIFCEYYLSKHDASRREKYFKTTVGKKFLRLMLKNSLIEIGYRTF